MTNCSQQSNRPQPEIALPSEIISKIIAITKKGNDATVKLKKDGYKVYETRIVEK